MKKKTESENMKSDELKLGASEALGEIEVVHGNPPVRKKRASKKKEKQQELTPEQKRIHDVVDDIFERIRKGEIDHDYCQIGFQYGKQWVPIYDYDVLVDLLINYGYKIKYILEFIDVLAEMKFEDGTEPIIFKDKFRGRIYDEIEDIPEVEEMMKEDEDK